MVATAYFARSGACRGLHRAHAIKVADVMTHNVLTATPDTPLHEIVMTMEKKAIKRVLIVRDGQLVGIVSRANLVQAIASSGTKLEVPLSDAAIREKLTAHLKTLNWAHTGLLNVSVNDGIVHLSGVSESENGAKGNPRGCGDDTRGCAL